MRCTATRRNGEQCSSWAVKGATVCRMHGGSAPQAKAKASERILGMRLNGELERMDIEPVADPAAALLQVAGEVLAFQHLCRGWIAKLSKLDYEDDKGGQDVRPAMALYERSLNRSVDVLAKLVSLGIQDRVARSQELTAEANLAALYRLIEQARTSDATPQELVLGMLAGAV